MRQRPLILVGLLVLGAALLVWMLRRGDSGESTSRDADRPDRSSVTERPGGGPPPAPALDLDSPEFEFGRQFRPSSGGSTATVTGRVYDRETDEAVPYVDIAFRLDNMEATAASGSDGRYQLELGPGTYEVRALGARAIAPPLPRLLVGRVSDPIQYDIPVVPVATVRGKVVYPDGRPAAGATVAVRFDNPLARVFKKTGELAGTRTAGDGRFELQVPAGDVELQADDGDAPGFVQLKDVPAGGTLDAVRIVLDATVSVAGTVRDPGGSPVGGAEVFVSVKIPRSPRYDRKSVSSDGAGRFELSGVRPGRVVVEATASTFAPSMPQVFQLESGAEQRDIVLDLHPAARLAGVVVDENGVPLEDVEVSRVLLESKQKYEKMITGLDGEFIFLDVAPGPHMVRARKRGYVETRIMDAMAPNEAIELRMPSAGGIRGTVTLSSGRPARQFQVWARDEKGKVTTARFFSEDGRYELWPLNPGKYELAASTRGHDEATATELDVGGGTFTDQDIELE